MIWLNGLARLFTFIQVMGLLLEARAEPSAEALERAITARVDKIRADQVRLRAAPNVPLPSARARGASIRPKALSQCPGSIGSILISYLAPSECHADRCSRCGHWFHREFLY